MNMEHEKPNKCAKQARSRAMVESLIESLTRILKTKPVDETTSNHIAEKAGVSIGSFYQYFKNKNALLETVLEFTGNKNIRILEESIFSRSHADWQPHVEYAIDTVFDFFMKEKSLHFRLFSQLYPLNRLDIIMAGREAGEKIFEKILHLHLTAEQLGKINLPLVQYIAVNSFMGIIQIQVYDPKKMNPDAVKAEMKALVCSYIQKSLDSER